MDRFRLAKGELTTPGRPRIFHCTVHGLLSNQQARPPPQPHQKAVQLAQGMLLHLFVFPSSIPVAAVAWQALLLGLPLLLLLRCCCRSLPPATALSSSAAPAFATARLQLRQRLLQKSARSLWLQQRA